jgi:hypothetical protein
MYRLALAPLCIDKPKRALIQTKSGMGAYPHCKAPRHPVCKGAQRQKTVENFSGRADYPPHMHRQMLFTVYARMGAAAQQGVKPVLRHKPRCEPPPLYDAQGRL